MSVWKSWYGILIVWIWSAPLACDSQTPIVRIVAQDFRFVPNQVHLSAHRPVHLVIMNQGGEPHVFKSRLFKDPAVEMTWDAPVSEALQPETPIVILPGKSIAVTVKAPPGVYVFGCPIRGHASMQGTFIVQD